VLVLDAASLTALDAVGGPGIGPGQFNAPYDVAVDSHVPPLLYVADNLNNRVQAFNANTLAFQRIVGGFGRTPGFFSIVRAVGGLSDDPGGGVAVADTGNNRVQIIRPDGTISAWGIAGRSAGYVTRPRGVAFAPDGAIAIADSFNHRIARMDPDGTFATQFGVVANSAGYAVEGAGDGQFRLPGAVAYDAAGNAVVADTGTIVSSCPRQTAPYCARQPAVRRAPVSGPSCVTPSLPNMRRYPATLLWVASPEPIGDLGMSHLVEGARHII
jgi:DNA-binding beta-propeller fold protein YncE